MDPISDFDGYNARLVRPLIDKMFFVDKIDANIIVDYGCGVGTLLRTLHSLFPEFSYIGYDNNPQMLRRARGLTEDSAKGSILYFSDWPNVQKLVEAHGKNGEPNRTALILSSVIHEVLSYENHDGMTTFWDRVWGHREETLRFDYVCVRDTMLSVQAYRDAFPKQVERVRQAAHPERLAQWEALWGPIDLNRSLIHFLLTYRYVENWKREYKENYLPLTVQEFLAGVPSDYELCYMEHFTPPFLQRQLKKDFGFVLGNATHLKAIFELKKE